MTGQESAGAAPAAAPRQAQGRTVAVLGAGAVGCYYGGMLARAGHAVTLIGRPSHVEAVKRDGLRFEARGVDEHIPMAASADPAAVAGATLVLVCVKSGDSDDAALQMRPHLDPGAVVMSLQNGVDNADRLQAALDRPVLPVVVYVATEMAGAGHVRHHGRGELAFGAAGAGTELAALFEAAVQFASTEGLIAAPEASHAIRAAIDEALTAKEAGEKRVIVFNLSGHGLLDLQAYDDYLAGEAARA